MYILWFNNTFTLNFYYCTFICLKISSFIEFYIKSMSIYKYLYYGTSFYARENTFVERVVVWEIHREPVLPRSLVGGGVLSTNQNKSQQKKRGRVYLTTRTVWIS